MSLSVLELEGTAAEIRAQLPDFSGKRLHVTVHPLDEDEYEQEWMTAISHEWKADWLDPQEDIYSLSDGAPVHVTR